MLLRQLRRALLSRASKNQQSSFPTATSHQVARRRRPVSSIRHATSPSSNLFWKELNQAVRQGNGVQAEEIVDQLLQDYEQEARSNETTTTTTLDASIFSQVLEAWRNSQSSGAAIRAHRLLEQMVALSEQGILSTSPTSDDYHAVLECWNNQSFHSQQSAELAHDLLKSMAEPTAETYEMVLSIAAKCGYVQMVKQLLEDIKIECTPTIAMYNSVLQSLVNSSNVNAPKQAQTLLRQMQNQEQGMPSPNGDSYDLVIQCWSQSRLEGAADKAEALLSQMKDARIRTTSVSYQHVITSLAKMGEAKRAEHLLTRLVKDYSVQFDAELKPALEPFQSVLRAYSRSYHPDAAPSAESVLTHMQELYQSELLNTQPNVWSYNMVLQCWAHSKRPDAGQRARDLFETMRSHGVQPDSSSLNTLLNTWASRGDTTETENIFWNCFDLYLQDPENNPQPDVISFSTVLKAWTRSRHPKAIEHAETLLNKLEEVHESGWEHCKPDIVIYASVMQCFAKSKRRDGPEKAEAVLRKMQQLARDGDPDMLPDTVCWNSAINAWAQAGNGERAESLFKDMLADYIQHSRHSSAPNIITFTAVLSAWAKSRSSQDAPDRAELLLERMEQLHQAGSLDVKPNVISYSIVLDCLANARRKSTAERAESLLGHMLASNDPDIQPNVVSFNSVIKAWSFTRDPDAIPRVTALLKKLIDRSENDPKMTPNANTFGSVLKTLADSRLPDKKKRAQVVVNLMEKYQIEWSRWSKNQLKRCNLDGGGPRRQTKKLEIPVVPDLKYT